MLIMAGRNLVDIRVILLLLLLTLHCHSQSFENGKTHKYSYSTNVVFNEANSGGKKDVGYYLSTEFDLSPVFQAGDEQLMKLQVTSAVLSSVSRPDLTNALATLLKYPVYFEVSDGTVGRVFGPEKESVFCSNLKKGIISLFQMQNKDGNREELDVSGDCKVSYVKTGSTVTKTKHGCQNLEIAGQYINPNKLFGVSVSSTSTTQYEMLGTVIQTAQGIHHSVATVNIKSSINTAATAQQSLQHISSLVGKPTEQGSSIDDKVTHLGKDLGLSLTSTLLPSGTEVQTCLDNCQKPIDVLRNLKESLVSDKLATAESGKAFIELLRTFRNTGKLTIEEILTNTDSYYIVPQLIDVGAATQTPFAQRAMMDLVQFEQDYSTEYPERLLLALAYSTHPGEYLLKDLINLMKKKLPNVNIQESVAMATGAVIHTYCQYPDQCQHEIVKEYKQLIRKMLKDCDDDTCTLRHLRSVGNAGLAEFLPELLTIAQNNKNPAISLAAVQALRRMDKDFLKDQAKVRLVKMYLQITREYDSSVRVAALELLVQLSPTPEEVYSILKSALDNRKEFELSLYTMKRVLDMVNSNNNVRESFLTALKRYDINNYNFFGHRGKSSAYTGLMAAMKDMNSSYYLHQETARTGVMKRSGMDVGVYNDVMIQPVFNFELYAEGLEALIGGGDEEVPEGGPEATAGMTLSLMDVLLRPIEFFRGSGGLMSAVWNAPSEPISALQANLLLHDHSQKLHLSNGLIIDVQVTGVASIDLSGSISISLWYKNSNSLIKTSGAMIINGWMKLESEVLQGGMNFTAESEAVIDFKTDVDFSNMPFKMCLQMMRPPLQYKYNLEKFEKSRFLKKRYRHKVRRSTRISPQSFFINEKNSEMCTGMFANE
ncbi:microsomal triglyceride transfer protein large subunit-like isoform X2 [Mytilus edulis]|uniref:microsomal triglyceride transfer protein large subunit-like isoform X2 n=1 Tax=Mytilus edulis TaxID=6550 RepID=UPI0039F05758